MSELSNSIFKLRQDGKTYSEISAITGASKGTISYHLGVGQKDKTVARNRDRRGKIKAYVQKYKQENPCVDCGENYPYWMMDFDHLRDKLFELNSKNLNSGYRTMKDVLSEIEKCEVVCANCHRNRTHLRYQEYSAGGNSMNVEEYYES